MEDPNDKAAASLRKLGQHLKASIAREQGSAMTKAERDSVRAEIRAQFFLEKGKNFERSPQPPSHEPGKDHDLEP